MFGTFQTLRPLDYIDQGVSLYHLFWEQYKCNDISEFYQRAATTAAICACLQRFGRHGTAGRWNFNSMDRCLWFFPWSRIEGSQDREAVAVLWILRLIVTSFIVAMFFLYIPAVIASSASPHLICILQEVVW